MEAKKRRDLLNLWVSDFLFGYTPDERTHLEDKKKLHQLVLGEAEIGHKPLGYRSRGNIDPGELYKIGEAYARKWELSISSMGLSALLWGCKDANQVQMMLAVGKRRFTELKGLGMAHDPMDALFVFTVFQEGVPSQEYFAQMWDRQKLRPGELGGATHRNMLDYMSASDFSDIR